MALEYTILYTKDGVQKTHSHTFTSEPTWADLTAVSGTLDADTIDDYLEEEYFEND